MSIKERIKNNKGKVGMIFAAIYILSPIDLVPELFLPFVGLIDDTGALGAFIALLISELKKTKEKFKEKDDAKAQDAEIVEEK